MSNYDIKLNIEFVKPETLFRENASALGGSEFTLSSRSSPKVAGHEFGHLLGFANTYRESTQKAMEGFSNDIMASRTGNVLWQHAKILRDEYEK